MKVFVAVLLVAVVTCMPQSLNENVRQQIDSLPFLLKDSVNTFNSKLFKSLTSSEGGNIIYSPFSLHMLLSQAYVGSPKGTPTSDELAKLLAFEPTDSNNQAYLYNYLKVIDHLQQVSGKKGAEVDIANRLFAAEDLKIKPDFKEALSRFYNSDIVNVDFKNPEATTDVINKFVSDKTRGIIDKILEADAIDGLSRLVMINAVYFKGLWKNQFKAEDTETQPFHVDADRKVDFSAMKQTKRLILTHVDEINADVIELPYENDALSMIVVVPSDDTDIKGVADKLENYNVDKINDKLDQTVPSEVELVFPKFEAEYSWEALEDVLKSLGVETVFDSTKSNLTDIANEELYVSKVAHKAAIKVNEEGTEAAAASGAVIATRNEFVLKKAKLVVDRPFVFYIYDVINRIPIFVGRIVDPNGKLKLQ